MRILTSLIICMVLTSGCGQPQNHTSDEQIKNMLNEFYNAYSDIWSVSPYDISPDAFNKRLDSLAERYSTPNLRKEAKEWMDDGHDLFTNDWGINAKDIQTMVIKKDASKKDTYIVTYTTFLDNPGKMPERKDVTLYIAVVKEGESYKIGSVK